MPLLFPNLRVHQVFGANTDVGKTLLTTALIRSSASRYTGNDKRIFYLKPVSTGPDSESDVAFVERHTRPHADRIATRNLFQYREPMSPHLAAQLAPDLPFPKSNDELVRGVERYVTEVAGSLAGKDGHVFVETAGGVHSPALHPPHTQSTFLRPLRLPAVLIASPHLGGISTTLASYESLSIRGYDINAVLCLHDPYYRNDTFLRDYFQERGVGFWNVRRPPEKQGTVEEDAVRLAQWYAEVEGLGGEQEGEGGVGGAVDWLDRKHVERIDEIRSMPRRTLDQVWWPFTQHGLVNKEQQVMVIDSAHGDYFDAYYAKPKGEAAPAKESILEPFFDGAASWFTQSHGHATEELTLAAAEAAGRYGHVLFPSGSHKPALELAEKLLSTVGKGWASRVFYSDNGSTGMEVALKAALRASGKRYGWQGEIGGDVGVIGLRGGYHGDTIGAMDATEASTFNKAVDWYKGRGHWFSPPAVLVEDGAATVSTTGPDAWPALPGSKTTPDGWAVSFGSVADVYDFKTRATSPLADYYRAHIRSTLADLTAQGRQFGALVIEPTCLGAGGMVFVDPLFQLCMVEVARASADLFAGKRDDATYAAELAAPRDANEWRGLPIIFDEVFSGLYRFGYHNASSVMGTTPDISCYAKILTGGLLPLSATVASSSIFNAFLSDRKVDALLHGHSYTANPMGCAVALRALKMIEDNDAADTWAEPKADWGVSTKDESARWSLWRRKFVDELSRLPQVKGAMAMGTVLAVDLHDPDADYGSLVGQAFLDRLRAHPVVDPTGSAPPFRIHSRPLGNVAYIMTSLWTKSDTVRAMEEVILDELQK
ncbi:Bifunctional dethiobiotin synthetase/7,8-diamino-pelargonic acid aminotransferase, mitochondrial [Vanrija pseudolonga]|uniref:Bifunctional dethiobiotin synthetase/7,8-diamino-pelargonic acid aminotransferase, mitochondrial n=1 Tax=Vanrija pseudolonga TaxID=143232 RepID=A0AAF0YB98_9TREE|nr:Bifunctional dethiobiotin synthetase/7,8-diamino-pelargonic acid aminotransferase, mitochondrial [Vanrija pseudolonga]